MKPTKLYMDGFITYKNCEYSFEDKPIVIQGENLDDESQMSNGSGKSAILAAMQLLYTNTQYVYLSAGVSPKPLPVKNLINYDLKKAYIWNETYCPIRKQTLKIERIFLKSGSQAQISINGEEVYSFADKMVKEINKFILDWLGYNEQDLINYYLTNKERFNSFFSGTSKSRETLINRFSNAGVISGIDKSANSQVSLFENELNGLIEGKAKLEGTLETHKENLETELNRDFETEKKERIETIKENIAELFKSKESEEFKIKQEESNIKVWGAKLKSINGDLKIAETSLNQLGTIDFTSQYQEFDDKIKGLNSNIDVKSKSKTGLRTQKSELDKVLDEINKNIQGAVKCPKCNHEFLVGDPDVDIAAEKEDKVEYGKLIGKIDTKLESISTLISGFEKEISKITATKGELLNKENQHLQKVRRIKTNISQIEDDIRTTNKSIKDCEANILSYKTEVKTYEDQISNNDKLIKAVEAETKDEIRVNELRSKITFTKQEISLKNDKIKAKEAEIVKAKEWVINFRKFKFFLSNKPLGFIQTQINSSLEEMGGDIRIKINGFKVNADGSTREEVTPQVYRNGVERSYGSFSGGERGRITFAEILSFQKILNSDNPYGGFNCLMMDEISEGVDSVGLGNLIKSLGCYDFPILVTTHVTTNVHENILTITKKNGVSNIKQNDYEN